MWREIYRRGLSRRQVSYLMCVPVLVAVVTSVDVVNVDKLLRELLTPSFVPDPEWFEHAQLRSDALCLDRNGPLYCERLAEHGGRHAGWREGTKSWVMWVGDAR